MNCGIFKTSELLSKNSNGQDLLNQVVGDKQIIALDGDDLQRVLACGNVVTISEGLGDTVKDALDTGLQSVQSQNINFKEIKGALVTITIRDKEIDTMEAMDTISSFFDRFSDEATLLWGLSIDSRLSQMYRLVLWFVKN